MVDYLILRYCLGYLNIPNLYQQFATWMLRTAHLRYDADYAPFASVDEYGCSEYLDILNNVSIR